MKNRKVSMPPPIGPGSPDPGGGPVQCVHELDTEREIALRQIVDKYHENEPAVVLKALQLACEDAWPGQAYWPGVYLKKARQVCGLENHPADDGPKIGA